MTKRISSLSPYWLLASLAVVYCFGAIEFVQNANEFSIGYLIAPMSFLIIILYLTFGLYFVEETDKDYLIKKNYFTSKTRILSKEVTKRSKLFHGLIGRVLRFDVLTSDKDAYFFIPRILYIT
jgi:hypothetical protein